MSFAQVQKARAGRIATRALIQALCPDFIELHGDRAHGDDPAVIGGIGRLGALPVTVIATNKGQTPAERLAAHGGSLEPWGYRQALRLMQQAAKFSRPVLTLIDTPGAFPGKEAEDNGQAAAIADLLLAAATLPVPMIAVIVGEGGSGGALALASGDEVWMTTESMYAILSPEGFAAILFKDGSRVEEAAALMALTPTQLLEQGVVERVLPVGTDFAERLQAALVPALTRLQQQPPAQLLAHRAARWRRF